MSFETSAQQNGLPPGAAVSRRDCLTSAAAAALGYTLAAGPVRAAAIKTGTDGLSAGTAKVTVPGGEMPVYYAKPLDAAKPPVILVAMEVFGLHEHIKDVTRRVAKLGAFAIAPDYYFRLGDLTRITEPSQVMNLANRKPDHELLPISTRRLIGPSPREAIRAGSASSAFAGAGARCGFMRRIIPASMLALLFTEA